MKTVAISDSKQLLAAVNQLQLENTGLLSQNTALHAQLSKLEAELAWFKRQIFGKRSERIVSDEQQLMLPGFERLSSEEAKEEPQTISPHKRRKPKRDGQDAITLSDDIPVKTVVLDVPEAEKVCKETGLALVKIGEEVTHKLAHQPGSYYVKETIRPKYAHPEQPENGVVTARLPDGVIPKCRADESLLAEIITKKFADHLPLYRIAEIMGRDGIGISHKLLSQWVLRCGLALQPLYDLMTQKILGEENVYIDESPVKLQKPGKCATAYMWVIVGGKGSNPAYRTYHFRNNRRHDHAFALLEKYHGIIHSDKYGAYQILAEQKQITWCPCFAHIRRKFFEAEGTDPPFRNWVLRKIRYLFMLERVAWGRSPKERLRIRQEKEIPILDELIQRCKERLIKGKILPKSKLREALGYFCSLIPYLKNYTKHPFSRLDNNVAERAVRPLALGRKNWLFFGSEDGGKAGAILLSLVQTCRGLKINPREYLEDVLRRIMDHNFQGLDELLPDRWSALKQMPKQE